jgi:antirestriction protein
MTPVDQLEDGDPDPSCNPPAEDGERRREEHPRIYVASLSDYNAGRLHGRWINVDDADEDVWAQLHAMLAASTEPHAEEFAIHDYDGFGPMHLDEYERIETVTKIGRGISEHGPAFAAWAQHLGSSQWDHLDRFEDVYLGEWESATDYAEQLLDDLGIVTESFGPQWLSPYIQMDIEAFARDLAADVTIIQANNRVYVFAS